MEKYIDIYAHIHTYIHTHKMAFMKIPKWIFYIDYYKKIKQIKKKDIKKKA